jgi:uncharacterized protein YqhQ
MASLIFPLIINPLISSFLFFWALMYWEETKNEVGGKLSSKAYFIFVLGLAVLPIAINSAILFCGFLLSVVSCALSILFSIKKPSSLVQEFIRKIVRLSSVFVFVAILLLIWELEEWNISGVIY